MNKPIAACSTKYGITGEEGLLLINQKCDAGFRNKAIKKPPEESGGL